MEVLNRQPLTQKRIFIFWIPLAATWLMMATEGPFIAAIIARLADPKFNLAAYGVAFSIALLVEAPIIMILSAATALVRDKDSFLKLRNFIYTLNGGITLLMLILLIPPVFHLITRTLMNLPEEVARLTYYSTAILLPWPGAIGYRRFYQGILIRSNLTRRVAYGTVIRLVTMASTGLLCYLFFRMHGAVVGALALSVGVISEAAASRLMAHSSVKLILEKAAAQGTDERLNYRKIAHFYFPLALTPILNLGILPVVTFFMGRSRMAIESLAVLPVIHSLVFIFRSIGLSFLEAGVALLGDRNEHFRPLRNFAVLLAVSVVAVFSVVNFTPLAFLWFHGVSGLSLELAQLSLLPTKILTVLPFLMVFLSLQRALMVNNRKTKHVTIDTAIELVTVILFLILTTQMWGMIGVLGAAVSLVIGRILGNGYLIIPCRSVLREKA
ncbi:MAG: hypothetical protein PVF22_00795 [Candidatus Aminicenantes bacterium]|jgi:hypothetical protein